MSLAPIHGIFIPRWRSGSFPWIWKWQSGDSYLPIVVHTCTFRSKWLGELIDCCCHGALTTKVTRPDNYIWPEICMIWALRRTSSVIDVGTNLEYKMGQHLFGLQMLTQIAFFFNCISNYMNSSHQHIFVPSPEPYQMILHMKWRWNVAHIFIPDV